jgi:LPLT family lysophospholipid transporter-like MFS transporter
MKKGFFTIMAAQFFSSLADNALFVAAVELLRSSGGPEWQRAALVPMFALFYVVLAPFVGAFADAVPKGRVMFFSNSIKVVGCLMMLFGTHPLMAYAIVGLGAAAYSPAKYGILTELLPPSQLVKANGWIEGLTISSIILGVLLGGQLVGSNVAAHLLAIDIPLIDTGVNTPPEAAIASLVFLYVIAALFNLRIPRTEACLQPLTLGPIALVRDFANCNSRLWQDKLGQISLATTTLFWGVSGNLRYIVLAWAAVIPLGIAMGLLVIFMNFISNAWVAAPFLVLLGGIGGFMVVPMNALLQHRGHNLMGAGRSIAVQNFNEQACILGLGAFYTGLTRFGMSAFGAITIFGLVVAGIMWLIRRWHQTNLQRHPEELERLMSLARSDEMH